MEVIISDHAKFEILRRRLSDVSVLGVVEKPEQTVQAKSEREIRQSMYYDESIGRTFLLRVVCEKRDGRLFVITAYLTSKLEKYWAEDI